MKQQVLAILLALNLSTALAETVPADRYSNPVQQFNYLHSIVIENNQEWAMYKIGKCYETGYGVKKNIAKAYAYYNVAATNHYQSAIDALAALKPKMSVQQLVTSKKFYNIITDRLENALQRQWLS